VLVNDKIQARHVAKSSCTLSKPVRPHITPETGRQEEFMPETSPGSSTTPAEDRTTAEKNGSAANNTRRNPDSLVLRLSKKAGRFLWYVASKTVIFAVTIAIAVLVLFGVDKAAELALWNTHLSDVYPKDFAMTRRDFTQPVSHYDYDLNPGVCLIMEQPKGNRYEYANNAGFRDPRPISMNKPEDEFRIFLTGGSTAFGLGGAGQSASLSNFYYLEQRETIAHALEKILNSTAPIPGKNIRVYNTAVWGYSYQHLLLRYITKLRQYKPDIVVSLDGVNELHPVTIPAKEWDYFREGQFNGILRQIFSYTGAGLSSYVALWLKNNTFLMTFIWKGADPFMTMETGIRAHRGPAPGQDAKDVNSELSSEERSRTIGERVGAVVRVIEDYHSVLENDGVPHIIALQPLLYLSKKPRHEMEKGVEALEEHKQYYGVPSDHVYKFLTDRIVESAHKKQYFVADFTEYFDDTSEWVFTDWCHLTAGANYLIAKELANLVKENFFNKPLAEGDKIDGKDSFFWNVAVTAEIVYAPPCDDQDNAPKNMLTGFPGSRLYSSKEVPEGERFDIVLDLGQTFALSRLRLVWDDASVPDEWTVDISDDAQTWKPWVRGGNKDLDALSWWPGYEYYGADQARARFLRYKPIKTAARSIKLRSWSVYR
jgi:hypothetical protein